MRRPFKAPDYTQSPEKTEAELDEMEKKYAERAADAAPPAATAPQPPPPEAMALAGMTSVTEWAILRFLSDKGGDVDARDVTSAMRRLSVPDEERREALLNLVTKQAVKVAAGRISLVASVAASAPPAPTPTAAVADDELRRLDATLYHMKRDGGGMSTADVDRVERLLAAHRALAAEVAALRTALAEALEALGCLRDVQNGPPLPSYEKDWTAAMAMADKALGRGGHAEGIGGAKGGGR